MGTATSPFASKPPSAKASQEGETWKCKAFLGNGVKHIRQLDAALRGDSHVSCVYAEYGGVIFGAYEKAQSRSPEPGQVNLESCGHTWFLP